MSRKIVDYKTLWHRSATDLDEDVKRHLADGWELHGDQKPYKYRNVNYVMQIMIKCEDEPNDKT